MDIVQNGKHVLALIQRILQIPRAMFATMSLGKDAERCLESNAKVVPCAADSPEEVGVALLGSCDYTPICKD